MPLKLITGPVNSGKTTGLLKTLKKGLSARSVLFVVPRESTARELRRFVLKSEDKKSFALMGDIFITWQRLIEKLAGAKEPLLSDLQTNLFVHTLISSHPLKYFRTRRPSIGIARQFTETILSLKKNGIGPARLSKLLDTRGSLKENDLLTLFARYEEEKKKSGLIDHGDLQDMAISKLKGTNLPRMLEGIDTIILDEFHCFTPGQMDIIRAFKKNLPKADILVSFPKASGSDDIFAEYLNRGQAALEEIANEVMELDAKKKDAANVRVIAARSPMQEARTIAREISEGTCAVLALSKNGRFIADILADSASFGMPPGSPAFTDPMGAPIFDELISPATIGIWPEKAKLAEYAARCEELVRSRRLVELWNEELKSNTYEREQVSRSMTTLSAISRLLSELKLAGGLVFRGEIRRDDFARIVVDELKGMAPQDGLIERILPVRVIPFDSGLSVPADTVIVPQMAEGVIPRRPPERLFFSETDRLSPEPDPAIDAIFPAAEDVLAAESYLFHTFVSKCEKNLLLSYSVTDEACAEVATSSFLDAFPEEEFIEPCVPLPSAAKKAGFAERLAGLAKIEMERVSGEGLSAAYHGVITSDKARSLVRKRYTDKPLSPTGLEKYAQCPFVFFAEKVLGLKPREDETPEINPKDRGTVVHEILEKFYARELPVFRAAVHEKGAEAKIGAILDRMIEEVCDEHKEIMERVAKGLKEFQHRAIRSMALQVIMAELSLARRVRAPLFPVAFEWKFGGEPANTLQIPIDGDKPALITGRVDRVDANDNKTVFLVTDYKTGRDIGAVKKEIMDGGHLQMPLYVDAVARFLLPGALPLGGLLLAVQMAEKKHGFVRKEYNTVSFDVGKAHSAMKDEVWDEMMTAARHACARHVSGIRAGKFPAKPADKCRRHCDYEEVCRYFGKGSD